MTRRYQAVLCVGLSLLAPAGCSLNLDQSSDGQIVKNQCGTNSDCGIGTCWNGMCVANQGLSSGVLIEVTPPTSVGAVGGTRLAPFPKNVYNLTQSSSDFKLHLPAVAEVDGFLPLDVGEAGDCAALQATLIPLEQSYGLPAVTYTAQAVPAALKPGTCSSQQQNTPAAKFTLSVAPGKYDIYLEPAPGVPGIPGDSGVPQICHFVPRFYRDVPVVPSTTCLPPSFPKTLNVKIQWPGGSAGIDSLEGWTIDIVHPTTGQLLSERKLVPAEGNVELSYSEVTDLSSSAHEDPGQDLVRLSPPSGVIAPIVQFVRSGLEALTGPNNGVTPPIGPFPPPVHVQGWVYRKSEFEPTDASGQEPRSLPVPSTVSLKAMKIVGVTPGIFASYSKDVTVLDDGVFDADVLPGEYRVRVTPRAGLGLAAVETTLSVACSPDPKAPSQCAKGITEAGKTLLVPNAATIRGSVAVPYGGGSIDGATVQALPAVFGKRICDPTSPDAGGPDAGCVASTLGVLDVALGEDAFVPRSTSEPANGASFRMTEVDCGGCGNGPPAYFDISFRSQDGSRFPWLIDTGVAVESDVDLGQLPLSLPIVQQGVVDIPNGPAAPPTLVPGALVQAYVIRDDLGAYVDDPTGMKTCTSVRAGPQQASVRCIRSVLQIGETRAGNDGSFELVLPSSIQ